MNFGSMKDQKTGAVLREYLNRLPVKILLVIENIQSLTEELSADEAWAIRKVLQNEPKLMMLATATSYFSELEAVDHAFFELFEADELKPLNETQATTLWNHLTQEQRKTLEVRPLQILTGGSPRLLTMLAQLTTQGSIQELMGSISVLIDERTDYFKSVIENLSSGERRVFLAMANLWDYSTAKIIAGRARMPVTTTSALLDRLDKKGALLIDRSKPRRKRYAIAERLICMYYTLRQRSDEPIIALRILNFMSVFYALDGSRDFERQFIDHYIIDPTINRLTTDDTIDRESLRAAATKQLNEIQNLAPDKVLANLLGSVEQVVEGASPVPEKVIAFESRLTEVLIDFHKGQTDEESIMALKSYIQEFSVQDHYSDLVDFTRNLLRSELKTSDGIREIEFQEPSKFLVDSFLYSTSAIVRMAILGSILRHSGYLGDKGRTVEAINWLRKLLSLVELSESEEYVEVCRFAQGLKALTHAEVDENEEAMEAYESFLKFSVQHNLTNDELYTSAQHNFSTAAEKISNAEILVFRSGAYLQLNRYDEAKIDANNASDIVRSSKDQFAPEFVILTMGMRASYELYNDNFQYAANIYDELYGQIGLHDVTDEKMLSFFVYSHSRALLRLGVSEKAVQYLHLHINKFKAHGGVQKIFGTARCFAEIGYIYTCINNYEEAVKAYQYALSDELLDQLRKEKPPNSTLRDLVDDSVIASLLLKLVINEYSTGNDVFEATLIEDKADSARFINESRSRIKTKNADIRTRISNLSKMTLKQNLFKEKIVFFAIGLAAVLEPSELLEIIEHSRMSHELAPIVVYLKRKLGEDTKEVYELSELAEDVSDRVEEVRAKLSS